MSFTWCVKEVRDVMTQQGLNLGFPVFAGLRQPGSQRCLGVLRGGQYLRLFQQAQQVGVVHGGTHDDAGPNLGSDAQPPGRSLLCLQAIRDDLVAGPVPRNNVIDVIVDRHVLVAQPGKMQGSSLAGAPEAHGERIRPLVMGDGGDSVALRNWRAHEAGHDAEGAFIKGWTDAKLQMLGSVRFPTNNPDFAPFVQRVKDTKPDVAFLWVPAGGQATPNTPSGVVRWTMKRSVPTLLAGSSQAK